MCVVVVVVGAVAVAIVIVVVAVPAAVVVVAVLGLYCEALCFLARANYRSKQQFAQHLFLPRSSADSYATISCASESEIFMV